MYDALIAMKEFVLKILNHNNLMTLFGTVIASFFTYRITKYSVAKPDRIKIKQTQLENVYLPLFKLFKDVPEEATREQVHVCNQEIVSILDRHYLFVFPQMHTLQKKLSNELTSGTDYLRTLETMRHQVITDYELLKYALGYPSENFITLFERMTFEQRTAKIVLMISNFISIAPIHFLFIFLFIDASDTSIAKTVKLAAGCFLFVLSMVIMGMLSKWAKKIIN